MEVWDSLEWLVTYKLTELTQNNEGLLEINIVRQKRTRIILRESKYVSWSFEDVRWGENVYDFARCLKTRQNALLICWSSADRLDLEIENNQLYITIYKMNKEDEPRGIKIGVPRRRLLTGEWRWTSWINLFEYVLPSEKDTQEYAYGEWERSPQQGALSHWLTAQRVLLYKY